MTESTQVQTTDNNNTAVVKMEPPPPPVLPTSSTTSDMPATSSIIEHLQQAAQQHQILQQNQQQYALKWNDFQSSILSSFRNLRDEEDFVDVTLACDKRSFTAHKVVLSACSPYFRKLLKANPCEHPIVILRDVCSNDVENLLSFMYNGEVNVSYENLSDFLKTAHLLQIRGLADVNGSFPASFEPASKSITGSLRDPITNLSNNNNNNNTNKSTSNNGNSNSARIEMSNVPSTTTLPNNNTTNTSVTSAVAFGATSFTAPSSGSITSTVNSNSFNGPFIAGTANTPAIQELKASSASPANNSWDLMDAESNRSNTHLTPPPQKRIKSADLFRAQHGISPERLLIDRDFPVVGQHPLTRERRDRSRDTSRDRDRNLELRDSLLSQALENNGALGNQKLHTDLSSLHTQSAGEDSNSSDTEPSDRGDGQHDGTADSMNGSMERSFPNAFLGLQGIPGLLPGPSGINANDFVSRRSLEMRVRATDPRPCPKCGKIYRSAHTLRTHLEDKHTVCPGYRCVLCGTVAKSRNSLHSHMSRQHRGISTKDLPVLPMPSPFDPELASRLLAKAGVKISAAELRARASPTNGGNSSNSGQTKLDVTGSGEKNEDDEDSDDDPEDLTTGSGSYALTASTSGVNELSRYQESLLSNFSQANSAISRIRNEAAAAAAVAMGQQKDLHIPTSSAPGQTLLDTYLQFITENSFGLGISQEHAAAAALHAAKMAQLSALGHGLEKLPTGLLPQQFDLSKVGIGANFTNNPNNGSISMESLTMRTDPNVVSSPSRENGAPNIMQPTNFNNGSNDNPSARAESMELGLDNNNQSNADVGNCLSDQEENFSENDAIQNS